MGLVLVCRDPLEGVFAELQQKAVIAAGPEGRQVGEPNHHEQRRLAHAGIGEDEHLGAAVTEGREIAAQKLVDHLEGGRPYLGDGLLVLMPIGRIVMLALGLDVETGELQRIAE